MEFTFLGKLRAALVWSNFGILFKSYIIIRLSVKKSDRVIIAIRLLLLLWLQKKATLTLWLLCWLFCNISNCLLSSRLDWMRRRYPWQPCKRLPLGTVTLNDSVEYLPTNTYLAHTSRRREGGMGKKPKHKMARKQQAIATTLCEELQASNCIYKSRGAPARGIRPPLV